VVEYSGYSPSNPEGTGEPGSMIANLMGFATVGVNIRGTGCSGGVFDVFNAAQRADGYDAIETVAAQDWVLGNRVGTVGLSYSGILQLYAASTAPPSLAAITPLSVIEDPWDQQWPGGIYNSGFTQEWLAQRDQSSAAPSGWVKRVIDGTANPSGPLPADAGERCGENFSLRSQNIDFERFGASLVHRPLDADARNLTTLVRKIEAPVYLSGGWQDEQTGSQFGHLLDEFGEDVDPDLVTKFRIYNGRHPDGYTPTNLSRWLEHLMFYVAGEIPEIPQVVRDVAGDAFGDFLGVTDLEFDPDRWSGYSDFGEALAAYEATPDVDLLWDFGAGMEAVPGAPVARSSTTLESWPPPSEAWRWYLGPDGALSPTAPAEADVLRYDFDPDAGPIGYADESGSDFIKPHINANWEPMAEGTGVAFETPVLEETSVIAGDGHLDLWFRSQGTDAGIEVVLSEVYPDGQEVLVQHGLLRAGYGEQKPLDPDSALLREPLFYEEHYEPLAPGEIRNLQIPIFPMAHPFRAGSKLRVSINTPGRDAPIWAYDKAAETDDPSYGGSYQEVFFGGSTPSSLALPLVADTAGGGTLPDVADDVVPTVPPCDSLRGQPCRDHVPVRNLRGCDETRFSDLAWNNPFCVAILSLADQGVIEGDAAGTFRPAAPVSRQAAAAFLYRTAGAPDGADPACTTAPFPDVPMGHQFCGEIAWLVSEGIASGYDDGTFRPTAPVSRQAAVAFLARGSAAPTPACEWPATPDPAAPDGPFWDVDPDHRFCAEVAWAAGAGIVNGYDDGTFRPTAPVSRQAMAAFLHRLAALPG
jgi:predicted acyl esterase